MTRRFLGAFVFAALLSAGVSVPLAACCTPPDPLVCYGDKLVKVCCYEGQCWVVFN